MTLSSKADPNGKGRLEEERAFYDAMAAEMLSKHAFRVIVDDRFIPWNIRFYFDTLGAYLGGLDRLKDLRVLDCGAGLGHLSVYLARRGAYVNSFDISSKCIEFSRRLAKHNGVADRIEAQECAFEALDYPESSFDLVLGKGIIHHVDPESAIRIVLRILKPGGRALFWEPTDISPLIRLLRKSAHRIGVQKMGTKDEKPLTRFDLDTLEKIAEGKCRFHRPPLFLFSLINIHILREGAPKLETFFTGIDKFLSTWFPALNQLGLHIVIMIEN